MSDSRTVENSPDKHVRQGESTATPADSVIRSDAEGLGRLLGVIAHEIKNPLSTIKVNLRLIDEDLEDAASSTSAGSTDALDQRFARTRRKIAVISKETTRLEQILDRFLRYADRTQPRLSPVDINSVLGDIIDFYMPQAQAHSITLRQHLFKEPLLCRADAAMLKQAVLNLFINAQQALGRGGELMVSSSRQGQSAKIQISDTGIGIPSERIDHIFEPYQSSRPDGAGLGLATVKKIISAHNGTITVASEPGKGTSFTITLPLSSAEDEVSADE